MYFSILMESVLKSSYCIVGKFGGVNVWRNDSYKLFGEEKFGE